MRSGSREGLVAPRLILFAFAISSLLLTRPAWAEQGPIADLPQILAKLSSTMEQSPTGAQAAWTNPKTGSNGLIIPMSPAYTAEGGQVCRAFKRTWISGSEGVVYTGIACREADGWWVIRV
jgi:hypothetical protein